MKTMKLMILVLITSLIYVVIPESVYAATFPPNPVSNIIIKQLSGNLVRISWDKPIVDGTHDAVESYDLFVDANGSNVLTEKNISSITTSIDINDALESSVNYTVTIKAINNNGSTSTPQNFMLDVYDGIQINNIQGQSMHGGYKNNTNTCANCHVTHQAKSATGLLTKSNVYESCISCHDGSLGFYNVFEQNVENDNGAGTFGGHYSGNMSQHAATGDLKIESAPGAELASTVTDPDTGEQLGEKGLWSKEFTCSSCHNPHGSSNNRLLQSSPNGYSKIPRKLVNGAYYGGLIEDAIPVLGTGGVNNPETPPFIGVTAVETYLKTIKATSGASAEIYKAVRVQITSTDKSIPNGPFKYTRISNGDYVICIYKYDKYLDKWVMSPFYQQADFSGDGIDLLTGPTTELSGWKQFDSNNPEEGERVKEGYEVVGWEGYVKVPDSTIVNQIKNVNNIATIFKFSLLKTNELQNQGITKSYTYKVDNDTMVNSQYDINSSDQAKVDNARKNMSSLNQFNEWCASCHIGFNISDEQKKAQGTNVYTHHSSSEDDKLPCVQCHYSHGTDASWMKGADGLTKNGLLSAISGNSGSFTTADGVKLTNETEVLKYLTDTNPSSALKRYTNTTSCFRCHGNDLPSN